MKPRFACGLAAVALLFAAPLAAQESADSLELGRKYTGWFLDGHADSLWSVMIEEFQGEVGNVQAIEDMMDRIYDRIGEESEVVTETAKRREDGLMEYRRTSEFESAPERVVFIWRTDAQDKIVGASIRPASQAPPE
jgi:hypothetical protein